MTLLSDLLPQDKLKDVVKVDESGHIGINVDPDPVWPIDIGGTIKVDELGHIGINIDPNPVLPIDIGGKIQVDESGYVGIGVDPAPSWSLSVGSIKSGGINVTGSVQASGHVYGNYYLGYACSCENDSDIAASHLSRNFSLSYWWALHQIMSARAQSSSYDFLKCRSGNGADDEFKLRGDGNAYADGNWYGGGADYADFFEWEDGNPNNDNRAGITVVNVGDKVRPAQVGETPIGVVSRLGVIVGNTGWNKWTDKYLRDSYGSYLKEDVNYVQWEREGGEKVEGTALINYKESEVPAEVIVPDEATHFTNSERVLNPTFDPNLEYVPREERPEWDSIGLLGRARITKGQPVASNWIKLRDIDENVEEWLIK